MLLGTEIGLSPGDIDGDPAPAPKKAAEQPPIFRPMHVGLLWPNG